MLKPNRVLFGICVSLFLLAALPLSTAVSFKTSAYSFLEGPIAFSRHAAQFISDLIRFRRNADEARSLRQTLSEIRFDRFQAEELKRENERLTKLLGFRRALSSGIRRSVFARIIGRSPLAWNRAVLIDAGTKQGIKPNMLVMSEMALVGKIVETGSSVSKVLLISDPNSRISVLIQRTREGGILYGTSSGECRMKYISVDADIKSGDIVETAGFGGFFPKAIPVGRIERVWKEPGQIYQVAQITPVVSLARIEEVVCVE